MVYESVGLDGELVIMVLVVIVRFKMAMYHSA